MTSQNLQIKLTSCDATEGFLKKNKIKIISDRKMLTEAITEMNTLSIHRIAMSTSEHANFAMIFGA